MENKVYVKKSTKTGKGIFAKRDIKKGEIVIKRKGWIISSRILKYFPRYIKERSFPTSFKKHILPSKPAMYVNHSCDPNTGIANNTDLVAIKNIKKDKEITYDYSMICVENWNMKCVCGSKNCRGVIKDYQHLDNRLKKKYSKYVPEWIRKKYG